MKFFYFKNNLIKTILNFLPTPWGSMKKVHFFNLNSLSIALVFEVYENA